jgi:alpha/beta superfamily hydrolase
MCAVRFRTRDGLLLEGELREADGVSRGTAVLCHPHPRHGGSKDHPLLWAIRNDLAAKRGLTTLVFNFRGVMGSEGAYGGGEAELADVAAAVDRVRQEAPGPTVLAGWSFGAWVSLCHAEQDARIVALALVAIPLAKGAAPHRPLPTMDRLERLTIPVLMVAGDRDSICPVGHLENLATWIPRSQVAIFPGCDHFFSRREPEVAERVGTFFERVLPGQAE